MVTSTRNPRATALAIGLMMAMSGGVAEARFQGDGRRVSDAAIPEGFLPEASAATGRLCVKQCPADTSPCDPPVYKQADGRCAGQWH